MTPPPRRRGARSPLGQQTGGEPGARVASSPPEQLPGVAPRTQGRDAKSMAQLTPKAGIDCSEARLDVHIQPHGRVFAVSNDETGWRALDARLKAEQVEIVGLEASGGCER